MNKSFLNMVKPDVNELYLLYVCSAPLRIDRGSVGGALH